MDGEEISTDLEETEVGTLYKKGKVEEPANYRPISLLPTTIHKLIASIIQRRMADSMDDRISEVQYGFRENEVPPNHYL